MRRVYEPTKMRQIDENEEELCCQLPLWKLEIIKLSFTCLVLFSLITSAVLLLCLFKEYTIIIVIMAFAYLKYTEIVPESE